MNINIYRCDGCASNVIIYPPPFLDASIVEVTSIDNFGHNGKVILFLELCSDMIISCIGLEAYLFVLSHNH